MRRRIWKADIISKFREIKKFIPHIASRQIFRMGRIGKSWITEVSSITLHRLKSWAIFKILSIIELIVDINRLCLINLFLLYFLEVNLSNYSDLKNLNFINCLIFVINFMNLPWNLSIQIITSLTFLIKSI